MTDDEALKILVALADSTRFDIFRKVQQAPGLSSSDLKGEKSASTMSHHFNLLVDARVLHTVRDGKHVRYHIRSGTMTRFAEWTAEQAELATLDDLAKYIADNTT
ncbi:MAG: ArsR/SmtB family transcription factor [Devosia sp.]